MQVWKKAIILAVGALAIVTAGCGDSEKKAPTPAPQQVKETQQQSQAYLPVIAEQFVEIYNKEIKQRHGAQYILGDASPATPGTTIYKVPDGRDSTLIIKYNQSDNKLISATLIIQGESGSKFSNDFRRAWAAAMISASSPGISNDDLVAIRAKILDGPPVTKNGINYFSQYLEKGSPQFDLTVKAQ